MNSARIVALSCLALLQTACWQPISAAAADRATINFDRDWRFHLG